MELKMNISPMIYRGTSKDLLLHKIGRPNCFGTLGNYSSKGGNDKVRVYSIEKYNKKTSQDKKLNKKNVSITIKNGETIVPKYLTKSKVIRKSEWVAYVYDIPVAVLMSMKLMVIQGTRNFVIKKQKI